MTKYDIIYSGYWVVLNAVRYVLIKKKSCERSFLMRRCIKSMTRTSTGQNRVSRLSIIRIEIYINRLDTTIRKQYQI